MGTRLDWPFSHTYSSPSRVYIVLVFCHVSEVANHVCVCVMKGEVAGSWYTEVDPFSLFLMLYCCLPLVIFVLAQCGSVKAQHGVATLKNTPSFKKEFSVLFTGPVAVLQRSPRTNPVITLLRLPCPV